MIPPPIPPHMMFPPYMYHMMPGQPGQPGSKSSTSQVPPQFVPHPMMFQPYMAPPQADLSSSNLFERLSLSEEQPKNQSETQESPEPQLNS